MTELEEVREKLSDTTEVLDGARMLARENPGSQAHSLTLRSLEKRQRFLEERVAKAASA